MRRVESDMREREYVLYVTGPKAGERGFPGKWSKEFDPSEQITGAEFQSSETKPTQKDSKTPMTIQPIKFSTLAELASGSPIVCIQGKITGLFDPNKGEGNYGPWVIQNGAISDGQLKHDIAFMDAEHVLPLSVKNKTIRVTAQEYKGKLKGIELKEKDVKGKSKRTVEIKFPSKIEILEGSNWVEHIPVSVEGGNETASSPQSTERAATSSGTQQTQQSSNGDGVCNDTMEKRTSDYFRAFDIVCSAAGHDAATEKEGLSPSDIKEITTGLLMSFKGQYGMHRPPIFEGDLGKSSQSPFKSDGATASQTSTTSGEEEAEPVGWREALHKNVKLGDYEEEKLAELIQWGIEHENPTTPAGQALRPQLMLADAELRGPASKKISKALASAGMGSTFDEAEVEEVCAEEFGSEFGELHYPSLFALGNNLKEYVAKMQAAWTAKQPAAAAPKKVAKKPAAASVEDDDGMPG